MPYLPDNFALLEPEESAYDESRVAVLPVPWERTTSYGKGTIEGPRAILRASQALELWDEELAWQPSAVGIATLPYFAPDGVDMGAALGELQAEAHTHLQRGKLLVTLGGEHSLTIAPVRAARRLHPELAVVQFDAHADLREAYEGNPYSHASVMRRVVEEGVQSLAVGVRSLSPPEAALIEQRRLRVVWGHDLDQLEERWDDLLAELPETVYLTFDLDFLDPSVLPATGTPEPGGGTWYPTLRLLRKLFECKSVVALDVVELAPLGGQPASDFLAAKLIYKMIGYAFTTRR